jgi:hypothetical protein
MAKFIRRLTARNQFWRSLRSGGFVMAAPRKSKSASGRTKKVGAKAPVCPAPAPPVAAPAPALNGNGDNPSITEVIRLRAYELFLSRNGGPGDEISDWLAAQEEVLRKLAPHD